MDTRDEVARAILKADEHLSQFENGLAAMGVDTGNSDLQFINLPMIVGLLYGMPDNEDTYNVICEMAARLDNEDPATCEAFIARVKEFAAEG